MYRLHTLIALTSLVLVALTTTRSEATESDLCRADIDFDGIVGGGDLSRLLGAWGACNESDCPEDLNDDGSIDGQDLSIVLGVWGDLPDDCAPAPSSERMTVRPIGTVYGAQGFLEYLPHRYEDRSDWPLIVALHGFGSNGEGSAKQLDRLTGNGLPRLITDDAWPVAASAAGDAFVILAPQNGGPLCHQPANIDAFLRWAIVTYDIDPTRVYLTGLSCGAIGTWDYLGSHIQDELLAAAVPICGDGNLAWNQQSCALGTLPIWGFHGDADDVVNVIGTFLPLTRIQQCDDPPAIDARLTIYPGVGHDSWTMTYDLSAGHDIYAWLLSHVNETP